MEQNREQLIVQANEAETLEQLKEAQVDLNSWHDAHPDDYEMNRLLGDLTLKEAWIRIGLN